METHIIYIKDLECYRKNEEKWKNHPLLKSRKQGFNLGLLPNYSVRTEMEEFIKERGKEISPLSLRSEIWTYHRLCNIINDEYPEIQSFSDINKEEMEKSIRKWILKNQKNLTQSRIRTDTGKEQINKADIFRYVNLIYNFICRDQDSDFSFDKDKWMLKQIPIQIRNNPTRTIKSISFQKIFQTVLRREVKEAIYIHLSQKALGTVLAEITAVNRFSIFLKEEYPEIESMDQVDREVIEEYLIYLQGKRNRRKSYRNDLSHLKSVVVSIGKICENETIENLFYESDIGNDIEYLFKVYSVTEIKRLNEAIVNGNVQVARALFLQQLLGTRICEILTLKRDSIFKTEQGNWMIRIEQIKTGRSYTKPITEEIRRLFVQACTESNRVYGKRRYVFVKESDPDSPMQYSVIQYHLNKIILENDLRDDHGKRFKVGTHIWRHCYATRLTELYVDDIVIAKLLGHTSTASLRNYRKIGNHVMAKETKALRDSKNKIISKLREEWRTGEM